MSLINKHCLYLDTLHLHFIDLHCIGLFRQYYSRPIDYSIKYEVKTEPYKHYYPSLACTRKYFN